MTDVESLPEEKLDNDMEYLEQQGVAEMLDKAVEKLVQAKPSNAKLWLALHFSEEPGTETLLGRIAMLEAQVQKLEHLNSALQTGIATETIPRLDPGPSTRRLKTAIESHDEHDAANPWMTPATSSIFADFVKHLKLTPDAHKQDTLFQPEQSQLDCSQLDDKCLLIVVDMQNDCLDIPDGGRSMIPEGTHAVSNVVSLVKKFVGAGAHVLCTRDYHPHDHCSFSSEGGPFPPHCVQGSTGSLLCEELVDCIKAIKTYRKPARARLGTVSIAFKGFHEDIDSVGAVAYQDGSEEFAALTIRKLDPVRGFTSRASVFTGAHLLKQSNFTAWDAEPDPNAPPDLSALSENCKNEQQKPQRVVDWMKAKNIQKLFVCGLAFDSGVLDTAAQAALGKHVPDTYIILDATRPASVAGYGTFGVFLRNPTQLKKRMQQLGKNIHLASTRWFLDENERAELRRAHDIIDQKQATGKQGHPFPRSFGPCALKPARAVRGGIYVIKRPTSDATGSYDLGRVLVLRRMLKANGDSTGTLSPLSKISHTSIERKRLWIPQDADTFCWAYPVENAYAEAPETLYCLHNSNFCFPLFGGFLYFKGNEVVGANGLSVGTTLHFDEPQKWPADVKRKVKSQDRLMSVTLPHLARLNVHAFAWIMPNEVK
eukprot:gene6717-10278_t